MSQATRKLTRLIPAKKTWIRPASRSRSSPEPTMKAMKPVIPAAKVTMEARRKVRQIGTPVTKSQALANDARRFSSLANPRAAADERMTRGRSMARTTHTIGSTIRSDVRGIEMASSRNGAPAAIANPATWPR